MPHLSANSATVVSAVQLSYKLPGSAAEKFGSGSQHGFDFDIFIGDTAVDFGDGIIDIGNVAASGEEFIHQFAEDFRIKSHEAADFAKGVSVAVDKRELAVDKFRSGGKHVGFSGGKSAVDGEKSSPPEMKSSATSRAGSAGNLPFSTT